MVDYDFFQGIDYALSVTGEESLYYGGHSMGCTQYLIMLSAKPEYNEKVNFIIIIIIYTNIITAIIIIIVIIQVKLGFLLAPPAYMSHAPSIIFQIASWANDIEVLFFSYVTLIITSIKSYSSS